MNKILKNKFRVSLLSILCAAVALGLVRVVTSESFKATKPAAPALSTTLVPAKNSGVIHAAGRGNLRLQDGRELATEYFATPELQQAIQQGEAKPRSLTSTDFNRDGANDLVSGYATETGGMITIRNGNLDATSPQSEAVLDAINNGNLPQPFLGQAKTFELPEGPDFLFTGDFNKDALQDVVALKRGSDWAYLLEGDGNGNFNPVKNFSLPGKVTTAAAGEINRRDGLVDLVIGAVGMDGAKVLVYEGANGGLATEPVTYSLIEGAPTSLALEQLDEQPFVDLLVAAGGQLMIFHGRDRFGATGAVISQESLTGFERINLPFSARSVTVGDFVWDRENWPEISVLAEDGSVNVLTDGELDTRPFTAADYQLMRKSMPRKDAALYDPIQKLRSQLVRRGGHGWKVAKGLQSQATVVGEGSPALSASAQILKFHKNKFMIVDPDNDRVRIAEVRYPQPPPGSRSHHAKPKNLEMIALDMAGSPVAALPMRTTNSSLPGLVILKAGMVNPMLVPLAPAQNYMVDRTDDNASATACTGVANDCSLRGAVIASNANSGPDTITLLGTTYTLTLGPPDDDLDNGADVFIGDLDIISAAIGPPLVGFNDNDLTVNGVIGSTIIQMGTLVPASGSTFGPAQNKDRIFDVDPPFGGGTLNFTLTGVTLQNAQAPCVRNLAALCAGGGGGAIRFVGQNFGGPPFLDSQLLVQDSVITNNTTAAGGEDAGGIQSRGTTKLVRTTISNNTSAQGVGGVLHVGRPTSVFECTGCVFNNNTGIGGTVGVGGLNMIGGTTVTIQSAAGPIISQFINNDGNQRGGGMFLQKIATINITGATISNNTSMTKGGGIYADNSDNSTSAATDFFFNGNLTLNGVTMKGNTATSIGGAIFLDRGTLNLVSSTIGGTAAGEPNTAAEGGGIGHRFATLVAANSGNRSRITINGGSITGNTSLTGAEQGGGILNDSLNQDPNTSTYAEPAFSGSTLTIGSTTAVSILDNKADQNGGGIANLNAAILSLSRTTMKGNKADNDLNNTGDGGAIFNNAGTVTLAVTPTANTIGGIAAGEPNTARNGGGIRNLSGVAFTINGGNAITGNTATADGGGISTNASMTLSGVVSVTRNGAANGGGLAVTGGTITINGASIFRGNTATGNGGGIFNNGATAINLTGGALIGGVGANEPNTAANGGGTASSSGTLTMTTGSITGNTASNIGGGVFSGGGTINLNTLTLSSNTAGTNGGGIGASSGAVNINGSSILTNSTTNLTTGLGGGIFNNGGTFIIGNTAAVSIGGLLGGQGNTAGDGGGIANSNGALTMGSASFIGSGILGNTAANSGEGGGVRVTGGTVTLNSLTIAANTAGTGGALYINGGTLNTSLSRIINNVATTGEGITQVAGTATVENNWWGCDGFPNIGGCETGSGTFDADPRIDLLLSSSPNPVAVSPATSTLIADIGKNSNNVQVNPGVMIGLPVTFALVSGPTGTTVAPGPDNIDGTYTATTTFSPGPNCGAAVASAQLDNPPVQNVNITVQCNSDLAVTKSDSPDPVIVGSNITYTINFINNGPTNDTNVTVTDAVPTNTTLVSAAVTTGTGWTRTDLVPVGGTGNIVFSNPDVPNGGTATFTIVVNVNSNVANNTAISNTATAAGDPVDPTPGNNSANTTTTAETRADVAITGKSDSPDPVFSGANITYTIDFINNGPNAALTATVTDAVPTNTTFVSVVTPAGWTRTDLVGVGGTGNIVFSKASVASGETAQFTVVVKVNSSVAAGTTITNTATADSATVDPVPANDSNTTTTTTATQADLVVTKTDSPDPVIAGANITYTVVVTNNGPSDAQSVTLKDIVPTNTTLVSATTPAGWTRNDAIAPGGTGELSYSIATLAAAASGSFTIVVKVAASTLDGTIITNNAVGASTTTDAVPADNTGTATTTVNASADLTVTGKTDTPDPVTAGNNITYAISFSSNGPSDAQTVTVTDAVPADTTFVSASITTGTGWSVSSQPAVGGTGNVVFSKATVVSGDTATFEVVVKVNPSAANGSVINNSATADSANTDPVPANDSAATTTTVSTSADNEISSKTDTPDPANAGDNITYTINYKNNGPSDAANVTVTDAVPTNTTFVSVVTPAGWTRTDLVPVGGTGSIVFTKGSVAALETAVFTIVVKIDAGASNGSTITNTATVTATSTDPDNTNDSKTATTTVKTCSPPPQPTNMVAWWTGDNTIRDIAGGNDAALNGDATYDTGKVLQGFKLDGTGDFVEAPDSNSLDITAAITIDAWINPTNAAANGRIVDKITPGNTDGYLFDLVSGNLRFISGTVNAQSTAVIPQGVFTHVAVTYDGTDVVFYINGVPEAAIPATGAIPVNALPLRIGAAQDGTFGLAGVIDEVEIFNAALIATEVQSIFSADSGGKCKPPDLKVTKTHTDPFVQGSTNNEYTITVTNQGPGTTDTAFPVNVLDNLPAGLTATDWSGTGWICNPLAVGGTPGPASLTCSRTDALAPLASYPVITLKVTAGANVTTPVDNVVTVSGGGEMDASDNSATDTTNLTPSANLSITKTDSPDPVTAGNNLVYTITVNNAGPSNAAGVSMSDTLPAGTTFVSLSSPGGWSCTTPAVGAGGTVTCTNAALGTGNSVFTLTVAVAPSVASGTVLSNTAAVTSTTTDPTPGSESDTETTTVAASANLSITKTDSPDPVTAGNNLVYTVTVNNAGPSNAAGVSVSDTLPTGTTFVSLSSPGGWSCTTPAVGSGGTVTCTNSSLGLGDAVFTLTVAVDPSVAPATVLSNTATVTSTTTDPTPGSESDTETTTVAGSANLSITKTDSPDPVTAGNNLVYTITVNNAGPSNAAGVSLSDTLPAGTTFVSLSSPGGWSCTTPAVGAGGTVTCTNSSLGLGDAVFTLTVAVAPSVASGTVLSNTAAVTSTTTDPTPGSESDTETTTVATSANLSVTKTDSPDPVTAGNNLVYTITVNNAGPSNAAGVSLSDTLPAGTTFVSLSSPGGWSCTTPAVGAGGTVTCTNSSLGAGNSVFTLTVAVAPSVASGTTLSNTAAVTSTTTDPTPGSESDTETTTVATSANLSITKTDSPDPVTAGNNLVYTITVNNAGPSNAAAVSLSDTLPAGTTFVSLSSPGGWTCTTPAVGSGGTVTCTNSSLGLGDAVFTLTVAVAPSVASGTVLSNTATVTSTTTDPTPGSESDTETTNVVTSADLLIVKTESDDPVAAGANLTYTITVTNGGSSDAQNLSLSDTLPANTTFVSFTAPAGWTNTTPAPGATGTVTSTRPTLVSGAVAVFTLVVNVNISTPHGTVLSNTAEVTTTTTDPTPGNNSSTATTTVISLPDAFDDHYFGLQDQVFNIPAPGVLSNDTGPSLSATPVVGGTTTAGGTYTLNSNGSFTYTPPAGFSGTDGFNYTVTNPAGSDTAHVELTVTDPTTIALRISEFRFNGPNGSTDEFLEIYNASPTAHQVGGTSPSNSGGYGLFASAGNGVTSNTVTLICRIPNGTIIPARGYVLCTGSGYSLAPLGSVGSSTGSATIPLINGAVATAAGNFPVINGTVTNPGAFTSVDVPNDAGLLLANFGENTVGASSDIANGNFGFNATGVGPGGFIVWDRIGFAPYGNGAPLQACHLVNPDGCGPSGSARPSLADNYCESTAAQCLRPVGDASTSSHGNVVSYGDSGQYSLLRRQTTDQSATIGNVPQDTANNSDDIVMVSPLPAINIAFTITNFATGPGNGLVSVLGAAGPQNNAAPADLAETRLQSSLFDPSKTAGQLPNAERRYVLDGTTTTANNNPLGSFIFRFGFRNMGATDINRLRFRVDNLSVLCGQASPAPATAVVGSGNARNLTQTSPNCQGSDNKTAVLKMLNMATEFVAPEVGPSTIVHGSVIEDTDGTKLAPNGGGINNSLVRTGTAPGSLTGEFTTVVPGGAPGPRFYVGFRMGVVKGGNFRFLFQPEGSSGTPSPAPTVP